MNPKTFGGRLRVSIELTGMSIHDFAKHAGLVDAPHLHGFLTGRHRPSLIHLAQIARALPHVDLRWLVCGEDE